MTRYIESFECALKDVRISICKFWLANVFGQICKCALVYFAVHKESYKISIRINKYTYRVKYRYWFAFVSHLHGICQEKHKPSPPPSPPLLPPSTTSTIIPCVQAFKTARFRFCKAIWLLSISVCAMLAQLQYKTFSHPTSYIHSKQLNLSQSISHVPSSVALRSNPQNLCTICECVEIYAVERKRMENKRTPKTSNKKKEK